MTTTTRFLNRFGGFSWAVTWGPGLTQTIICTSEEEAAEVAKTGKPVARFVEPLVSTEEPSYYCPDYPADELVKPCDCDKCAGACNNGKGGKCGDCFACEEIADNEKFWQANRADILQI